MSTVEFKELRRIQDNNNNVVAYIKQIDGENEELNRFHVETDDQGNETLLPIDEPEFDFTPHEKQNTEMTVEQSAQPVVIFSSPLQ